MTPPTRLADGPPTLPAADGPRLPGRSAGQFRRRSPRDRRTCPTSRRRRDGLHAQTQGDDMNTLCPRWLADALTFRAAS